MDEYSESGSSAAFSGSSLAYTISETELVSDWLDGKTPQSVSRSHNTLQTESSSLYTLTQKLSYSEDENKERGNWSGKLDFVLSMLGYAVGPGNVWRFPYLCYSVKQETSLSQSVFILMALLISLYTLTADICCQNGGGAFLFPYFLMLCVVGIPLFYLEVSLGQFCSRGPAKCWDFAPIFKGVGVSMIVASILVSIYYNMIIAWAQFYLFASFTSILPWTSCDNPSWNTNECSLKWPIVTCDGVRMSNGTCYTTDNHFVGVWNRTLFYEVTGRRRVSPSEEYFLNNVLALSSGIFKIGSPRWHLTLSLLLAWIVTFLCLLKGVKTLGKVVYFTALFPYVVLAILFFRGVTLDSAGTGIFFYIVPDFEHLGDAKLWRDATNQIFYSLGPAWGGLITLSSYSRFHHNALRDTLIVGIGNCLTSLLAGFVIFSYLGHMAAQIHENIGNVVTSGPGLAFIVYPEAVTHLPIPPLWSFCFFLMLILLGLDSQFTMVETVLTGFLDQWPWYRTRKVWVTLTICAVMFLLGLPLTTNGGAYMLNLMDAYAASWSLMVIGLTETLAISYVYGCNRFLQDMTLMYGSMPRLYWKLCWMCLSPSLILFILVFACADYSPTTFGTYTYPPGGEALGWLMVLASLVWIPGCAIYKLVQEDEGKTFMEKLKLQIIPNKYWGPALVKHRRKVDYVKDFVLDPNGDKKRLTYVNQAFSSSSYSNTYCDDRGSLGTRDMSLTTLSFDDDIMFTSTISLETSV